MGWEVRMSNSRGKPYFYNKETNQSSWDPPSELTPEEIKKLQGAHLLERGTSSAGLRSVRASHLLVKHRDSRRPSSWREANITRTKEEAIDILNGYKDQIDSSADPFATFSALAKQNSDCSSASRNGDLGTFERGQMQKPFEDATFALQVGEMSDIVETDSGVHLIYRTA
ncbi:rotamase-domain-containing protein [Serendipita vermifera]|nr:rotamase-domain-containing protein [Serendipita vermifera]